MRWIGLHLVMLRLLRSSNAPSVDYIDPGTGSMILQVILGGVAGVAVMGKMFWHRIVTFIPFRGRNSEVEASEDSR